MTIRDHGRWAGWLCGLALLATHAVAHAADTPPKAPRIPKILSLSVQPESLTFYDSRDQRSLLVTGHTAAGYDVDLTPVAHETPEHDLVSVDSDGFITPLKAGRTVLNITAAGAHISVPIVVKSVASPPVSFVREVMPVLAKVGCNAGTCHGAARGKNGFKLSLRGYDADFDHHALIDDVSGRRFNRTDPARSLMLLKPTAAVPHKGGMVLKPGSRYYNTLLAWISEGAGTDGATVKRASRIEVLPTLPNVTLPGMEQRTLVLAHFSDGTTRDVTREAVFTSSLPEVATVTPSGTVAAARRGEAALLVRYEGCYASNGVTVLGDRTGYRWASVPEYNYIDALVDRKLKKIKALPSGLCDDATFVRRATIDLTGLPPTPEQTRAFLSDHTETREKREKLVDSLMGSPAFVDRWTNKWADLLSANSRYLGDRGVRKFRNWIRENVEQNTPYNQFVQKLLLASGDAFENPAANYLRVAHDTSSATEKVTQLFLGVRFSCNKCHDHPFERWTQNQYYQFGAFFARVGYKNAPDGDEVVYDRSDGEVLHPKTNLAVLPEVPVGAIPRTADLSDRRAELTAWLTSADNPFFSRAMVNRLWSYFTGRGIIDPVDDIRGSNPPVNPELLEALNQDFVRSGFDMRHMMRVITLSRTYQASIATNKWNEDDKTNFSHALPRRLEAEELLDAIHLATGTSAHFQGLPDSTTAEELPDASGNTFLDLFGRPARETPCECERSSSVSLGQALNLINGPTISDAIADKDGRLAEFMKTNPTDKQLANQVFLAALARYPSDREMKESLVAFKQAPTRAEGAQDLMWALLNSPAFLFNR